MRRIKALVAAVALAVSGIASAITTPADVGGTQNADVLFLAFDQVSKKSFVLDTNITFASLAAGATGSFNLAANTLWTSFLTQTGGSFEWLMWGGSSASSSLSLFTKAATDTLPSSLSFSTGTNVANLTNLGVTANNFGCLNVVGCSVVLDGNVTTNWGGDLLGTNSHFVNDVGFKVTGANGDTMNIYSFAPPPRGQTSDSATLLTTVSLSNGTLLVGPVPEPSTYALMVAGLLTVGAVARRRMRG